MKAAVIRRFGGPDVLSLEEVARPVAAPGEVLVKVHAAGVNPIDYKTRTGTGVNRGWGGDRFPLILGWDVSGVVEASSDPAWKAGDDVFALTRFPQPGNAYAQYAAVPAAELARKPKNIGHEHAAGVPLAALTAWQAMFDRAGLAAGQTVLIHAAAGGVGHIAVQLAKIRGARVVATASGRNESFVRSLGADVFVDYTRQRFEDVVRDVDVVFHTIGADQRPASWKTLKKGGWLVAITGGLAEDEASSHGAQGAFVSVRPNGKQLAEIARLIEQGRLCITVDATYDLADVAKAHEHQSGGHARGKIVLRLPA
jgi:NADPH:quinone reductase-like Zn-dependent oxidoreductase